MVPQLLRIGSRAPASPLGCFWSLSVNRHNLLAQQKTYSSSSAHWSPISEGAELAHAPREEAALAQGRWGASPPPAAAVNRLRPCHDTTPQENLQTPSERAYPSFKHITIQTNSTEGGKENAQRTKGQGVRIKPSPLIPGQMAYP